MNSTPVLLVALALMFGTSAVIGAIKFGRGIRGAVIPVAGVWLAALLAATRFLPVR